MALFDVRLVLVHEQDLLLGSATGFQIGNYRKNAVCTGLSTQCLLISSHLKVKYLATDLLDGIVFGRTPTMQALFLYMDLGGDRHVEECLAVVFWNNTLNLLADGCMRAAKKIGRGAEYYAMHIKGMEIPAQDGRSQQSMGLAHATSSRGADHLKGFPSFERRHLSPEMGQKYWGNPHVVDPRSPLGKVPAGVYYRLMCTLADLLGVCKFVGRWFNPLDGLDEKEYAEMTSAATGVDFSADNLLDICRRVYTLEQVYNNRLGLTRKDDTIPQMFFKEPFNTGPLKGHVLKEENFQKMLDEYYEYWGWDKGTGIPTRKALESLDLADVAKELNRRKILPK